MKKSYLTILIIILSMNTPATYAQDMDSMIFYPQSETEQGFYPEEEKSKGLAFYPLDLNSDEVVFKTTTRKFDTIDPSITASFYPGGRGANKLIIYTPNFGLHTGTNEFGTEAIVTDNTVTAISGADSTIPTNGLVISGHGSAKNWISQNITVGSKVYVDTTNRTLTVYTTSESYTHEAKEKIEEAQSMINWYKATMHKYNPELAENHIRIANNYLKIAENEKGNSDILKQYTQEAIDAANMAIKTALPFIENELKGTWIRPVETTQEQIINTLDNIKANGFNAIFLETYYHGKTIFPSQTMNKYGFTIQNENFEGFDPLEIWIKEAHARGIKVHIWFQSFYVGNKPAYYNSSSILSVRPDWGNKTQKYYNVKGATKSVSEHNGYFIDPANPEVHEFLLELLSEIITTYKPDGINLDYIRYPNASIGTVQNSWGYTEYARNEFKEEFGVDPAEITTADAQWYDWNQYRRNKITSFVQKAGKLCRDNNTFVSTVIFPDIASALGTKQQDWRTWSENDYIDGFTPLFLTYDPNMLVSMMSDVERIKSPATQLYAGIFVTFMGGAPEDLIKQIYQTRRMNANGVILFDWAHTTATYTSTLMASSFKETVSSKNLIAQKKSKKKVVQPQGEEQKEQQKRQATGKVVSTTSSKGTWVFTRTNK